MKTRHISLVAALILIGAAAAAGFTLNGPKWATQQVPYYINPSNAGMSEDDAIAAIQAGAMAWTSQSHANILPYYVGRTSGSSLSKNGKNEVFFRNAAFGNMYGETYWWYSGSTQLVEADTVFYNGA